MHVTTNCITHIEQHIQQGNIVADSRRDVVDLVKDALHVRVHLHNGVLQVHDVQHRVHKLLQSWRHHRAIDDALGGPHEHGDVDGVRQRLVDVLHRWHQRVAGDVDNELVAGGDELTDGVDRIAWSERKAFHGVREGNIAHLLAHSDEHTARQATNQ